jgi:hypothetical protein
MARTLRASLLTLLVLFAAACTGTGKNAPRAVDQASVRVANQSWSDMTIYVLTGSGPSARQRLGQVTGNGSATFTIPEGLVGMGQSLRFLADPLGSSNVAQSFEIYVRPGQRVTLTIPPGVR